LSTFYCNFQKIQKFRDLEKLYLLLIKLTINRINITITFSAVLSEDVVAIFQTVPCDDVDALLFKILVSGSGDVKHETSMFSEDKSSLGN